MAQEIDTLAYTTPFQLTSKIHRDPDPKLEPAQEKLSQKDRIVIITGATGGIGEATAHVFAKANAKGIVLVARSFSKLALLEDSLRKLNSETTLLSVKADVSDKLQVKNVYDQIKMTFGRSPDVLINLAGIMPPSERIGDQDPDLWWSSFEINLKGTANFIHYFIAYQANPEDPKGTIVNVSSGLSAFVTPYVSSYSLSKFAQQRLTEFVSAEYANLRVFTTIPGIVKTTMAGDFEPYALDHHDLIGQLSLYLTTEKADFLKGCLVSVNWDTDEMEEHAKEIQENNLLKINWLPAKLGPGGHPWSSNVAN